MDVENLLEKLLLKTCADDKIITLVIIIKLYSQGLY